MTRIPRLLISKERWPQQQEFTIKLLPKEQHYLFQVLRLKIGHVVSIFDGSGRSCSASIGSEDSYQFFLRLAPEWKEQKIPKQAVDVILVQGLLKNDKFDWVVEKATELGVARIIPMMTERSNVAIDSHRFEARLARWNRIAQSAAGQCGRTDVPHIEAIVPFRQVIVRRDLGCKILCWEEERAAQTLATGLAALDSYQQMTLFIGPEGGFSKEEATIAGQAGSFLCSLGPRVLRAETAALCALSIVGFLLQES